MQGHIADNLPLGIKKLQAKIIGMQHGSLRLLTGIDKLQGIAESLNSLRLLDGSKALEVVLLKH